uniref:Nuclear receptor-binding factor 2 MIT domain-containing protein n=1 Tax=Spermophilus dauricus TaxID=99837 RepID=A0A8C9PZR7_SPEDA
MEVMEAPLNLAHQQSRRADHLLAAGKYEEAISCHKKAKHLGTPEAGRSKGDNLLQREFKSAHSLISDLFSRAPG